MRDQRSMGCVARSGDVMSMVVLTFFNHAGGVAKTSTIRDIGYVLAEQGGASS
jgi:hypothetical protein